MQWRPTIEYAVLKATFHCCEVGVSNGSPGRGGQSDPARTAGHTRRWIPSTGLVTFADAANAG